MLAIRWAAQDARGPVWVPQTVMERLTHEPEPKKPHRPVIGLRWIGNRYQWWRLLATIAWIRGVAEIPGVPRWQCPR